MCFFIAAAGLQVAEMFCADVELLGASSAAAAADGASGSNAASLAASTARAALLLRDVARLDTAVTVVDAAQLMANLHSVHTFRVRRRVACTSQHQLQPCMCYSASAANSERTTSSPAHKLALHVLLRCHHAVSLCQGGSAAAQHAGADAAAAAAAAAEARLSGGHRQIAELLLEQIECADVLVLNKADTVAADELPRLQVRFSHAQGCRQGVQHGWGCRAALQCSCMHGRHAWLAALRSSAPSAFCVPLAAPHPSRSLCLCCRRC